jgi:hypothetical protein
MEAGKERKEGRGREGDSEGDKESARERIKSYHRVNFSILIGALNY